MAWDNPKLDWLTNPVNPTNVDMNRIENNIAFINSEIENKKGAIVDALVGVGIATTLADTHAAIASKILAAEKTEIVITPSTVNQNIPKGIYDTGGGIVIGDPDLIAANILGGKNIFNVPGSAINGAEMRKRATGTTNTANATLTVNGLTFTPGFIYVYLTSAGLIHWVGTRGTNGALIVARKTGSDPDLGNSSATSTIVSGGFTIYTNYTGYAHNWIAVE